MGAEQLTDLFRKYGDDVFRLAYSYLGSRADGEDVCQSVFLKLAEGKVVLLPGREKSWLLTCAANLCKSQLRSFWRRNVGELEESILSGPGRPGGVGGGDVPASQVPGGDPPLLLGGLRPGGDRRGTPHLPHGGPDAHGTGPCHAEKGAERR